MFGFIKKLFGGIFSFLGGLLGGKKAEADTESTAKIAPKAAKSNGFYLELDETGSTKSEPKALKAEPAKAAAAAVAEPAKAAAAVVAAATEPVKAAVATIEAAPEKVEAALTEKKAKTLKSAKAAKAKAAESENSKVTVEAQPNPPAPETNGKVADQVTFAPNYLMPTASSSRRRPGPSMNTFRDMARQVKTPG
jgi:type IV secretory pathway VirB10-like protein